MHLKHLHDQYNGAKFLVSGSANAALSKGSEESGAGRFTDFYLPPLTFQEYICFLGAEDLLAQDEGGFYATDIESLNVNFLNYTNYGGYPEIALSGE